MDPISQHIRLEELPTPGSRFELQELIGEGTYSKVYAAMDKQKGERVAVKIINDIAENIIEIESEYLVLSTVGGQSLIPKYHGTYLKPKDGQKQLWFVMELCDGVPVSELLAYLRSQEKPLQEEEIAALMKMFMMALHHLHKNDIIYRDVRAANFIISPSGDIKLIDFGACALVKDSDGKTNASIGAPYWMAPEVISSEQDKPYTKACDVWSLGITAIELAEHQPPLFDLHPVRAMFQIARNPPPTLKKMASWNEPLKDFISECLERNPENRPMLLELMLHPFLTSVEDSAGEEGNMEEKLSEDYVPEAGNKVKEILQRLGEMVQENLYPLEPSKPMCVTVKNWHFKSDADTPYRKQLPEDLAAVESVSEDSALEHLLHRFCNDEIYSYIGDILLAVNPRVPLPLYDAQIEMEYWEKARSDNAPHVFAIADRAYQQMLHHKQSQVILLFGKWSSGKSFSTTQIINHLAFLCPGGNVSMAEKIQQLTPLLDAFGNAKTIYNSNASRLLKMISITFTKTGKTTGAIISATLLDRMRISNTPEGECNYHILYYIYDGLKAEKRLSEFGLDKLSAMRYMPMKCSRNPDHSVTAFKALYHAFRILSYTEEEILLILRILSAILLLGDVTYTMKGSMATANNPYLITQAAKNLSVDNDRLFRMIGNGPDMEELMKKRDGWVQFLYLRLFEWIVSSVNATLSFSRAVMFLAHRALMNIVPFVDGTGFLRKRSFNPSVGGSVYSVTVIDPPGFGTSDLNPIFRLGSNVIDDFLQNYMQQLMFFKELEEYKEECVEIPFNYEDTIATKQSRNELIECEKTILTSLNDPDQWSSLSSDWVEVGDDTVAVKHIFDRVEYHIQDLQAEDLTIRDEPEYLELFSMTDDKLTSAVANNNPDPTKSLGEDIVQQLDKMLELVVADYPHLILCIIPTESCREDVRFEPDEMLKQLRAMNFMETIIIRQQGYARRVTFSDFLNRYRYLAFDFDEEVELNKENSQLLLIRLKMDGWAIGNNKVFLKYYTEEYLTRIYETYIKKLVKIQAMCRSYLVKIRRQKNA